MLYTPKQVMMMALRTTIQRWIIDHLRIVFSMEVEEDF
ncbi:hypothetical protein NSP_26060 [Nodularia spumigena CCY9414]|nr:hypothetical protein NSP_26060 [Nodularia spumigena CCY9414]